MDKGLLKNKRSIIVMWIVCVMINLKSAFTDYDVDTAYSFAMSYRKILGDDLFGRMREPHQTAAFLTELLTKFYMFLVGDNSGVVLFVNICGVALFAIVAVLLTKVLAKYISSFSANLLGMFFFLLRPKLIQSLEYSNMLVIFSTLLFISMGMFFEKMKEPDSKRSRFGEALYIYLAALFLCLSILSYPSALILYLIVSILIFVFADRKWVNFFRMTGFCAVFGTIYFLYVLNGRAVRSFYEVILAIFNNDTHSGESIYSGMFYWIGIIIALAFFAVSVLLAELFSKSKKETERRETVFLGVLSISFLLMIVIERCVLKICGDYFQMGEWNIHFAFMIIPIGLGIISFRNTDSRERIVFITGMLISGGVCISVILFTNLPLLTVLGYAGLGTVISCIPIVERWNRRSDVLLICLLIMCLFGISSVKISSLNYVREGPMKYMVSSLEQCNKYKLSYQDWQSNVFSDDVVLIPKEVGFDATFYEYTEAGIAAASTISTPFYGEYLMDYWEEYPEKEPTVVAVFAWDGVEELDVPEWLINKIDEEYCLSAEGEFWHFYRKK